MIRLRRPIALALGAALPFLCATARSQDSQPVLEATQAHVDANTGEVIATEGAKVLYGAWLLSADTIRFNRETGEAHATGKVVFTRADLRLVADKLVYKPQENFAHIENFRAGNGRAYVDGSLLQGNPDRFQFDDVNFYPGEPGTFLFKAKASQVTVTDQRQIKGQRISFKVGPVPVLLIPNATQPIDAETNYFRPELDYDGHLGLGIGAEILAPVANDLQLGGKVTLLSKRGVLVGPAARYSREEDGQFLSGSLVSGYISDQGNATDLGIDLNGNPVDKDRYFAEWQHRQGWQDGQTSLNTRLSVWSDSEVTRDFYEEAFNQRQDPDSYLEANYKAENWQLSFFTRAAVNDFQVHTERLPELSFTYLPTPIAGGLSHHGYLSVARLERDFELSESASSANRLDAYYGLDFNKPLARGLNLRLKAGTRHIRYDDARIVHEIVEADGGNLVPFYSELDQSTTLGDIGADLNLKAYAIFELKNDTWNIDGLRHVIEPRISYRYTPVLDRSYSHQPNLSGFAAVRPLTNFDTPVLANYLAPIDLEERRDVDALNEDHKLRFELRNRLETRHPDGGSRELARLVLATEYYLAGSVYEESDFSLAHIDLALTPADWLEASLFARLDPGDSFSARELSARFALTDSDYWKCGFGSHFLRDSNAVSLLSNGWGSYYVHTSSETGLFATPTIENRKLEQYFAFGEYALGENLKIYAVTRYDKVSGTFYEQRIGLMQRALERYGIKYELRFYDGDRRESGFGFTIGVDLFDE